MTEAVPPKGLARASMLAAGLIGVTGLLIQAYVSYHLDAARGVPLVTTVSNYFSYFTILTNILVASAFLTGSLFPRSRVGRFANHPAVTTGLVLYIDVVGIVYVSVLAGLWNPQGLQWWADLLLHKVTPISTLLIWIAFVPKLELSWSTALTWLPYPAAYLAVSLIRGEITGEYPYPFINVVKLGWPGAIFNCVLMTGLFLGLGYALVGINRRLAR